MKKYILPLLIAAVVIPALIFGWGVVPVSVVGITPTSGLSFNSQSAYRPFITDNTTAFTGVTAANLAVADNRVDTFLALNRIAVTDGGAPAGTYAYVPAPAYNSSHWIRDFFLVMEQADGKIPQADVRNLLDWIIQKQIQDNVTTYTYPASGGTGTYPKGTIPDHIHLDGTPVYMGGEAGYLTGDRASMDNHFFFVLMAWHYGNLRSWDSTWASWFNANKDHLEDAFNAIYSNCYNSSTKLIDQWSDHPGTTWGYLDIAELTGGNLGVSVIAHNAASALAEMYYKASGTQAKIDAWAAIRDNLKTGIRAAFITETGTWDYYKETWRSYPIASGVPEDWTLVGSLSDGVIAIIADPSDSTKRVLRVQDTSATGGVGVYKVFTNAHFQGQFDRVKFRSRAAQDNAAGIAAQVIGSGGYGSQMISITFGNDGHFKELSSGLDHNLPTDTTYSINTWYDIELVLNWTAKTYEIYINGASKGSGISFNVASAAYIGGIDITNTPRLGVETGDFLYGNISFSGTVTGGLETDNCGYLPWSTGDYGSEFSPDITALAVWSNILTPTQATQAGRFFKLLYNQPTVVNGSAQGNLFSKATNYRDLMTHIRWSDHERHGTRAWPVLWSTAYAYGIYIEGGYWYYALGWALKTIEAYDNTLSQTILGEILRDVDNVGANSPYERVDDTTPANAQYTNCATCLYGAGNTALYVPPTSGWIERAAENFNRPNENPLDNGVWVHATGFGDMAILDNIARISTTGVSCVSRYIGVSFGDNQYSQAALNYTQSVGLEIRSSGSTGYLALFNTGAVSVYKHSDVSTFTQIGSTVNGISSNAVCRFEVQGTTLRVFVAGVKVFEQTDSTYTSGSPGIYAYGDGSFASTIDNWSGGDYTP